MPRDQTPAARPARAQDQGEQSAAELLKDDFGWALGVILRAYRRAAEEIVDDVPGGPRGFQVVASASQHLANNQGVMAAQLGIDRTVLTYLIDDLEAAGLVTRQPDPTDRRNRRVVATEAGLALWRDRRQALARAEAHILSTLGGEMPAFKALLQRVAIHANQIEPLQDACQVVEELDEGDARHLGTQRRAAERP